MDTSRRASHLLGGVVSAPRTGLTAFQITAAEMFFSLPESDGFLLAGGAALAAQHLTARPTQDLEAPAPIMSAALAGRDRVRVAGERVTFALAMTIRVADAGTLSSTLVTRARPPSGSGRHLNRAAGADRVAGDVHPLDPAAAGEQLPRLALHRLARPPPQYLVPECGCQAAHEVESEQAVRRLRRKGGLCRLP
jgi:hypothetical protein